MNLKDSFLKLSALKRELDYRKNVKIYKYNTGDKVHLKQLAFHKASQRMRFVFGGNRSGKTECGAVEVAYMARGIHPFRQNRKKTEGWVVSLSSRVQKDVAQKKVLSYLDPRWIEGFVMASGSAGNPENGLIEKILVKNVSGETSVIGFKSVEEGREKFQGSSLDYVWFDEEPPQDVFDECLMRVLDRKGDIFCTMTPLKGRTFIYDRYYLNKYNDSEVVCFFMSWADNPFLDAGEVVRLKSIMSDDELEMREFGRFSECGDGQVYTEFSEEENVVEPFVIPNFWQDIISIDPGLNNPLSAHWYACDPETGNIFVVAEHFEKGQNVDYHAQKIKDISEKLGWKKNCFGGYDALIDSAGNQTTLNNPKSVSQLFTERGIYVNAHVNKDLFSGISKVKSLLKDANGTRHLFVFKTCVNLIREFKGYRWGKADVPIKTDDHALDELRYYVNRNYSVRKLPETKTEIQKDKERLYRQIRFGGV